MDEKKDKLKIIFIIVFVSAFVYLIININIFNKDSLIEFFALGEERPRFGMIFTTIITVLMVFFVPISWFSALGAFFFGLRGFLYVIIGGIISSILAFYIAKIFKQDVIKIVNKVYYRKERDTNLEQVSIKIERYGVGYVFFMRSMPFIPFSIANYVSGLTSISLKDYILGTMLGLIPGQFISTYFFVKAVDIKQNPLGALIAAVVKGLYVLLVILCTRKSKFNTKE